MRITRNWTPDEDAFLFECNAAWIPATKIARLLDRSINSVWGRKRYLCLTFPPRPVQKVEPPKTVPVADIKRVVAEHFNIPLDQMLSREQDLKIARPRQVAMFFAREVAKKSYANIGRMFGGRDHSTALHARKTIARLCSECNDFAEEIEDLKRRFVPVDNSRGGPFLDSEVSA